jgi:hypothetical protein
MRSVTAVLKFFQVLNYRIWFVWALFAAVRLLAERSSPSRLPVPAASLPTRRAVAQGRES